MAKCKFCNGEMLAVVGCTTGTYDFADQKLVSRIPFGLETRFGKVPSFNERCHDCGAARQAGRDAEGQHWLTSLGASRSLRQHDSDCQCDACGLFNIARAALGAEN